MISRLNLNDIPENGLREVRTPYCTQINNVQGSCLHVYVLYGKPFSYHILFQLLYLHKTIQPHHQFSSLLFFLTIFKRKHFCKVWKYTDWCFNIMSDLRLLKHKVPYKRQLARHTPICQLIADESLGTDQKNMLYDAPHWRRENYNVLLINCPISRLWLKLFLVLFL